MLTDRLVKHYGIRVNLMIYAGLTVYTWDKKNSQLKPPEYKFLWWNWIVCLAGGFYLDCILLIQIYIKVSNSEEELTTLQSFATLVLLWGEATVILVICLLATRIYSKQKDIMYLMNQMFRYHGKISTWLKENEITLDEDHKIRIRAGEFMTLFTGYFSYCFPVVMFLCLLHPLEPIHNLMLEWLEVDLSFKTIGLMQVALLFPALFIAILAAGNTIFVLGALVTCYYMVATTSLEDMTPQRIIRKRSGGHCTFQTKFYGNMEDEDIVLRYREQQLFNVLLNKIMASIRVSLQHPACLATCSIMAYFAIKFHEVLEETGVVGYIIVGGSFIAPLAVQFFEAEMLGTLVDVSEALKDKAYKMAGKGAFMRVFARSCITFYVQEAYPFFTVSKETILEFGNQVVDYTITLLLW